MEIERKYLIKALPGDLADFPSHLIEQAYLNRNPVVRIRREDDTYYLTYKGGGMMIREEYNLPLNKESYEHLLPKCDGKIITKIRHLIPLPPYTVELDEFQGVKDGLLMAEVEFPTAEEADSFIPPEWFGTEVTNDPAYHNSNMSK